LIFFGVLSLFCEDQAGMAAENEECNRAAGSRMAASEADAAMEAVPRSAMRVGPQVWPRGETVSPFWPREVTLATRDLCALELSLRRAALCACAAHNV
jgi:hypothetical protein